MHNFRSYDDDVDNVQDVLMKKEIKKKGISYNNHPIKTGSYRGKILRSRDDDPQRRSLNTSWTSRAEICQYANCYHHCWNEGELNFIVWTRENPQISIGPAFVIYYFFLLFFILNKNFVEENLTTTRIDSCFSLGFPIAFNYRHENGDTKAEIRTVVWEKTHTTSDNHHPVTLVTVKRRLSIRIWSLYERRRRGGGSSGSSKKLN